MTRTCTCIRPLPWQPQESRLVLGGAEPPAQPGSGFAFPVQHSPRVLQPPAKVGAAQPGHGVHREKTPSWEGCSSGPTAAESWVQPGDEAGAGDGDAQCARNPPAPGALNPQLHPFHIPPGQGAALPSSLFLADAIKLGRGMGFSCMEPVLPACQVSAGGCSGWAVPWVTHQCGCQELWHRVCSGSVLCAQVRAWWL